MKPAALFFKIYAIILWLYLFLFKLGIAISDKPNRDSPADWGTPAYFHRTWVGVLFVLILFLLSAVPNRWLVYFRVVFISSIIIALFPFFIVMHDSWASLLFTVPRESLHPIIELLLSWGIVIVIGLFGFAPLPLSIVLSFWRRRKGQNVRYV
jgi:glucan phosphoethanolaminetransferase (alkaline phosphatase superfamily)